MGDFKKSRIGEMAGRHSHIIGEGVELIRFLNKLDAVKKIIAGKFFPHRGKQSRVIVKNDIQRQVVELKFISRCGIQYLYIVPRGIPAEALSSILQEQLGETYPLILR